MTKSKLIYCHESLSWSFLFKRTLSTDNDRVEVICDHADPALVHLIHYPLYGETAHNGIDVVTDVAYSVCIYFFEKDARNPLSQPA